MNFQSTANHRDPKWFFKLRSECESQGLYQESENIGKFGNLKNINAKQLFI